MRDRTRRIVAAALVAVSVSGLAVAQPVPPDPPPPAEPTAVKGTVIGMNLDADGQPNGLMLRVGDGPPTQVNFPPHMAAAINSAVHPGAAVTAMTRPLPPRPKPPEPKSAQTKDAGRPAPLPPAPTDHPADHPVAELVALTPDGGDEIKVVRPDDGASRHVDGKIARLNYTRDGQVDGALLDNGTFVHTGPAAATTLKLAVGQTLSVDGTTPPHGGNRALAARSVNGTAIERPRPRPRPDADAPPIP